MYVTVDLNRWKPIKSIKKVSKAILKTRVRDPLAFQESFLSETQLTRRTTPFDDDDLSPQLVYIIIVSSVLFVSIRAQFKVPRPSATDSTKTWQEREISFFCDSSSSESESVLAAKAISGEPSSTERARVSLSLSALSTRSLNILCSVCIHTNDGASRPS